VVFIGVVCCLIWPYSWLLALNRLHDIMYSWLEVPMSNFGREKQGGRCGSRGSRVRDPLIYLLQLQRHTQNSSRCNNDGTASMYPLQPRQNLRPVSRRGLRQLRATAISSHFPRPHPRLHHHQLLRVLLPPLLYIINFLI